MMRWVSGLAVCVMLAAATPSPSQVGATIQVTGNVLALGEDPAARERFAREVLGLADASLASARTESDRRDALTAKRSAALVLGRWQDVIAANDALSALQAKPALRALEGLVYRAMARTALAGGAQGSQFERVLRQIVGALDGAVVAAALRPVRTRYFLTNKSSIESQLVGPISANLKARGGRADLRLASDLLEQLFLRDHLLPLLPGIERVLAERLARPDMKAQDRWTSRTVDLAGANGLAPVIVGIWDSGIDPDAGLPLWVNRRERLNGRDDDNNGFVDDIHGFAFDPDRRPATGMLGERPGKTLADFRKLARYSTGWSDVDNNEVGQDALFARSVSASLSAADRANFTTDLDRFSLYTHGTGIASIAAAGNPAIRLMMGRLSYRIGEVPQPIDEAAAASRISSIAQSIAYFRDHGARIVNMSFRLTEPNVEASLAASEPDPAKRAARARTIYSEMHDAFAKAVAEAPAVLFLAGAGNANENNDEVRSFPAGIRAPNLITVGAIDSGLQPADITSLGKSVDVYALGVSVRQSLAGGGSIRFTGTSSATPQVSNLAAKLLALCPSLSPAQLKSVIVGTASEESALKLRVVNPKAAVSLVRGRRCRV